jgi:hypothetical protein
MDHHPQTYQISSIDPVVLDNIYNLTKDMHRYEKKIDELYRITKTKDEELREYYRSKRAWIKFFNRNIFDCFILGSLTFLVCERIRSHI